MSTAKVPRVPDRPDAAGLWAAEYAKEGIPSSFRTDPSGSVRDFIPVLQANAPPGGAGIDIGCGTGRNALHLAGLGYRIVAIDQVAGLIRELSARATDAGLGDRLRSFAQPVTERWPTDDRSLDFAIDTFCFKHLIEPEERRKYRAELGRCVRPGGLYLLTLAGVDDGYYGMFLADSPRRAERVMVDPANGIGSVLYTKDDVEAEFGALFEFIDYRHRAADGLMHGRTYRRSTHMFIARRRIG